MTWSATLFLIAHDVLRRRDSMGARITARGGVKEVHMRSMRSRGEIVVVAALLGAWMSLEPSAHPLAVRPSAAQGVSRADAPTPVCTAVTSIEIVHRVGGAHVTDKVRLTPGASADPDRALRSFQRVAAYFGPETIVSSRPLTEVYCFPADNARDPESEEAPPSRAQTAVVSAEDVHDWCGDHETDPHPCLALTPDHRYDYSGGGSCSMSNHGEAVSVACEDSGVIVSRRGDVVLTGNTANLRQEAAALTQALRSLLGDANVLTNFHFNIVISPDQQAALVGNQAFADIAQQIRQASDLGQPLPDIQGLLRALPQQPTNVAFFEQLKKAYQTRQERLELLAQITSGARLSPQQVNAFYQHFVGKSQLVDRLLVERSAPALTQAAGVLNQTIAQLANADPLSTIYEEVKAGARAVLEAHTSSGVFDPDHVVPVVPPLYSFLTDANLEKRLVAAERLIDFNETLRKGGTQGQVEATRRLLGLLARCMGNNDMDQVYRVYDQVEATKFFAEGGDPRGTRYDVHLSNDARTMFNLDVTPTSAAAYDVTVLLNEVADYHRQTGQISGDYQAIIALNAREALRTADALRALYHTAEASSWFDTAKGFVGEVLDDFADTASGIFHTVTQPLETYEGLKAAIANWDQTLALVWQQGAELLHRWPDMTPDEKADILGRLAGQIVTELPSEVHQAGRVQEATREAVRIHLDKAELGLRIIERGGVALAPEAAAELVRRMEHFGVTAVDDMIELADELDDHLPCRLVGGSPPGFSTADDEPACGVIQITGAFNDVVPTGVKSFVGRHLFRALARVVRYTPNKWLRWAAKHAGFEDYADDFIANKIAIANQLERVADGLDHVSKASFDILFDIMSQLFPDRHRFAAAMAKVLETLAL